MSNTRLSKCPPPDRPEFAFIGRSNVGKSSLINMLTNQKNLAKTSQKPGKTQHINHFLINESWYLVDLPGYGYARVSKSMQKKLSQYIVSYINQRENLYCLFVLIDARHSPLPIDMEFISWLGESHIPFALVFTKADKLGKLPLSKNIGRYRDKLREDWEQLPPILISSSEKRLGREEILTFIGNTLP